MIREDRVLDGPASGGKDFKGEDPVPAQLLAWTRSAGSGRLCVCLCVCVCEREGGGEVY